MPENSADKAHQIERWMADLGTFLAVSENDLRKCDLSEDADALKKLIHDNLTSLNAALRSLQALKQDVPIHDPALESSRYRITGVIAQVETVFHLTLRPKLMQLEKSLSEKPAGAGLAVLLKEYLSQAEEIGSGGLGVKADSAEAASEPLSAANVNVSKPIEPQGGAAGHGVSHFAAGSTLSQISSAPRVSEHSLRREVTISTSLMRELDELQRFSTNYSISYIEAEKRRSQCEKIRSWIEDPSTDWGTVEVLLAQVSSMADELDLLDMSDFAVEIAQAIDHFDANLNIAKESVGVSSETMSLAINRMRDAATVVAAVSRRELRSALGQLQRNIAEILSRHYQRESSRDVGSVALSAQVRDVALTPDRMGQAKGQ